jgi:hypothetical protein
VLCTHSCKDCPSYLQAVCSHSPRNPEHSVRFQAVLYTSLYITELLYYFFISFFVYLFSWEIIHVKKHKWDWNTARDIVWQSLASKIFTWDFIWPKLKLPGYSLHFQASEDTIKSNLDTHGPLYAICFDNPHPPPWEFGFALVTERRFLREKSMASLGSNWPEIKFWDVSQSDMLSECWCPSYGLSNCHAVCWP